jgi:hypothetical protein
MSIELTEVVDFATIDKISGDMVLSISDHLAWDGQEMEHLFLLQKKLNAYLRFVESGEVFEKFPETLGRNVVIDVVGQFPLTENASRFIEKASAATRASGIALKFSLFRSN